MRLLFTLGLLLTINCLAFLFEGTEGAPAREDRGGERRHGRGRGEAGEELGEEDMSEENVPDSQDGDELIPRTSEIRYRNPRRRFSDGQCDSYMVKYGYMRNGNRDANQRRRSIRRFQRMAGLAETGVIDDTTNTMMQMPRCGNSDDETSSRKKRFSAPGNKWTKTSLTYNFKAYTSDLSRTELHRIIRTAFNYWSAVTPLVFTQISDSAKADIEIIFGAGVHTSYSWDRNHFDGSGGTLAHAFFPVGDTVDFSGDAHFDDDENFTDGTSSGINLLQVAVHEFGHSLGLGHSNVNAAVMAPFYRSYIADFELHPDDIAGIQSLYGSITQTTTPTPKPTTTTTTRRPTTNPETTITTTTTTTTRRSTTNPETTSTTTTRRPRPTPNPETTTTTTTRRPRPTRYPETTTTPSSGGSHCDNGRVNAITVNRKSGDAFIFTGSEYMVVDNDGIISGYPRPLRNIVPFDAVDAAVALPGNYMYVFRKRKIYSISVNRQNNIRFKRGPFNINSLVRGLPNNIDAIFQWSNNRIYAFKGNQYYRLSRNGRGIDRNYPRSISVWRLPAALSSSVDAITRYGGRTYFFKNGQYYRYNDRQSQVDSDYPKSTAQSWFGCSQN